mgnify:FL=1
MCDSGNDCAGTVFDRLTIAVACYYRYWEGTAEIFDAVDANGDGKIWKAEFPGFVARHQHFFFSQTKR